MNSRTPNVEDLLGTIQVIDWYIETTERDQPGAIASIATMKDAKEELLSLVVTTLPYKNFTVYYKKKFLMELTKLVDIDEAYELAKFHAPAKVKGTFKLKHLHVGTME